MIEKTVFDYLTESSDLSEAGLSVFMETPVDPPAEYILVEKTGSDEEDHIKTAVLAVQSHADSLFRAAEINELVKSVLKAMISEENISRVTVNSDYNFTNTETKKYRYQAVIEIIYWEA